MTEPWLDLLPVDPLPALLGGGDLALDYFARRALLDWQAEPVEQLWDLPEVQELLDRQQADGSWHYPGKSFDQADGTNYDLLQTYRTLRRLVELYGMNDSHPAICKAAEYLFSCQTEEGDIRGILVNQYMPYYHGAILTPLVKAGYADDPRLVKGMDWLLSMRQEDGGWIVPAQAVPAKQKTKAFWRGPALPPDRSLPSSHLATDMALRPFAAHPVYRSRPEALSAARLLKSRLLQPDKYNDRKGADYWLKLQFPFWWHSLVATLDSLSRLGFDKDDDDIARGLIWFLENQEADGLWDTRYGKGKEAQRLRRWVGLAVCRVLKRFFGKE
ncbi:MAG: prenyltransferase/squalene oxidase repeat-containing protein [Chloroflexota bacterium]